MCICDLYLLTCRTNKGEGKEGVVVLEKADRFTQQGEETEVIGSKESEVAQEYAGAFMLEDPSFLRPIGVYTGEVLCQVALMGWVRYQAVNFAMLWVRLKKKKKTSKH